MGFGINTKSCMLNFTKTMHHFMLSYYYEYRAMYWLQAHLIKKVIIHKDKLQNEYNFTAMIKSLTTSTHSNDLKVHLEVDC